MMSIKMAREKATCYDKGLDHELAIVDGRLYAWGRNHRGQLGLGDTIDRSTPCQVGERTDWEIVTAGMGYSLGTTAGGRQWEWGAEAKTRVMGVCCQGDSLEPLEKN